MSIATKSSQKISQTPSVVSVYTSEQIKAMGARDLFDVLQLTPGFGVSQTRSAAKSLTVRGVSSMRQGGRILVLLDGTPYNDIMYGTGLFFGYEFNMDAIERIEIIRGPGSALYGRNAFSCVINIITKTANEGSITSVSAAGGTFNTLESNISHAFRKKEFSTYVSAKYFTTDGTNQTLDDTTGNSIWNLKHDNIYLNTNLHYKNWQFNGSFVNRTNGTSFGALELTEGNTTFKIGTYNLMYNKDISSNTDFSFKIYGRNEHRTQDIELVKANCPIEVQLPPPYSTKVPASALYPEGLYAQPVFDTYTYGLQSEFKFRLLKNNQLLTGIQFDLHGIKNASIRANYLVDTPDRKPWFKKNNNGNDSSQYSRDNMPLFEKGWIQNNGHDYNNLAIYIQDVHQFNERFSVTIGGRFDYDSEVGFIFNPRIGMNYEPTNNLFVKALYGEAYRAPTTNEQYKIMGWDKGNDQLKNEEIRTIDFAIGYNSRSLFTQVTFYANWLNDIIMNQEVDSSNVYVKTYNNAGSNLSLGFELETKYSLNKNVFIYANYSFTHSENSISFKDLTETNLHPNIAKHMANAGLNIKLFNRLNWSSNLHYMGKIEKFINPNENFEYVSQDQIGNFILLNSSLVYENILKGLDISFQGYNLFNAQYHFQDNQNEHMPAQPGISGIIKLTYHIY